MAARLFRTAAVPNRFSYAACEGREEADDEAGTALLPLNATGLTAPAAYLDLEDAQRRPGEDDGTEAEDKDFDTGIEEDDPVLDKSNFGRTTRILPRASSNAFDRSLLHDPSLKVEALLPADGGSKCHAQQRPRSKIAALLDSIALPLILASAVAYVFSVGFLLGVHWEVRKGRIRTPVTESMAPKVGQ